MPNEITLETHVGTRTDGEGTIEWPQDVIRCNGQKIGFVGHAAGSPIQFIRILSGPTARDIAEKVQALRSAQGKAPIGDGVSMPPTPEQMRSALAAKAAEESGDE